VGAAAELLRREGLDPTAALGKSWDRIVGLVEAYVKGLGPVPSVPALTPKDGLSGTAYRDYRGRLHAQRRDGDLRALVQLEQLLGNSTPVGLLPQELRLALFDAELGMLSRRVEFLVSWWTVLRRSLLIDSQLAGRAADSSLDELINSRFPQLVHREAEFAVLGAALDALAGGAMEVVGPEVATRVEEVQRRLGVLEADVAERGRRLLAARTG
jgi:hypothetical protein